MKRSLFCPIIVVLLLASCSQYEKLRKSTDYALKYEKAVEYYNKEDYAKASLLFDDVVNMYRGTTKADTVYYYQAMSYFKQKDYLTASHYFDNYYKNMPQSPFAEECEFLTGYSYYMQSPRASLDQVETDIAIDVFQLFLIRHPKSKYYDETQRLLAEMRDKLVDKSYITAGLYFRLSHYKASIVALNNSLTDYPNTKYREELMFLLLKSSYLYAENSVLDKQKERYQAAADEYYSFVGEFPQSRYIKEAQQMFERTDQFLKNRLTPEDIE